MSKLVAAALLGALGYFVADLIGGHLPPEELQNWLRPMSAFFGVLVGWRYLGKNMRGDWSTAIGLGLSAGALVTLISLNRLGFHRIPTPSRCYRSSGRRQCFDRVHCYGCVASLALDFRQIFDCWVYVR